MLNHKETDKARHYLELLDDARCNSKWQDIPELSRKVEKHSPQRQCLTLTARTEQRVAEISSDRPVKSAAATGLSQAIPLLQAAIEKEKIHPEDAFQARICMAWLHRTVGDQGLAISCLPPALDQASERLQQEGGITAKWTYVCIIKAAYIRGTALEQVDKVREAARAYASILPYLSDLPPKVASILEHQLWTERLLVRYVFLTSRYIMLHRDKPGELFSSAPLIAPGSLFSSFRAYARFYDSRDPAFDRIFPDEGDHHHLMAWKAYYDAISIMVQHDIVQPIFKSRLQQSTEFKRVEGVYQGLLLKESGFPRADHSFYQIELWVDQVTDNWRAMCGRAWNDEDLGDGDKASLSRGVLEILYKASTRSFHSTRVLRHLFTVHMALAEFHLAGKALDTYLEIFKKSRARIEKSGATESDLGCDDDATALVTAAAGIKMLCAYGRRKEAEKALSIASVMEQWLQELRPGPPSKKVVSADDVPQDLVEQRYKRAPIPAKALSKALALGYHALGVSQSCWARLTYETSARSDLQAQAISNFHTALDPYIGDEHNIEIQYSLAFALADTRDLDAAIATVKGALSWATEMPKLNGVSSTINDRIRRDYPVDPDIRELLLKCWHLLALLLSARQSFTTAIASCEAALELYGEDLKASGPVGTLELYEKKSILEIRMTQLALTEIVDGAEEAVNASGELLNLYAKLFLYSEVDSPKDQAKNDHPPSGSANGTVKSFRASILGFPRKTSVRSRSVDVKTQNAIASSLRSSDSREGSNKPPAISVTDDDALVLQNPNHHGNFLGRHESNKLRKRNSKRSVGGRRRSRATSPTRIGTADSQHHHLHLHLPSRSRQSRPTTADGSVNGSEYQEASYDSNGVGVAISHDLPSVPTTPAAISEPPNPLQGIQSTAQNMNHRNPNTHPVHPKPPPSQNRRRRPMSASLFTPTPIPHFSLPDQQRHTLTLLTKIWLLIAALYRRAGMPVDAQGALSEATKHVESVETAIATRDGSSAENLAMPGYGGLKSCGELWADSFAEQAALHVNLGKLDQATTAYETALGHYPEHVAATVGLSTILLEAYSNAPANEPARITEGPKSTPTLGSIPTALTEDATNPTTASDLLSRLAARDRAYGLLSALTKSGTGWDSSEAWYGLATAYEASGQIKKAKEALWWVVKLEEGKGIRTWDCIV